MIDTEESRTATEAQINANRENAASSRNGLKHVLCTNKHLLLDEDPEELLLLTQNLLDRFRPVGPWEEKLVLRIANCQWRLNRASRTEAGIDRDLFHDVAKKDEVRQIQYDNKERTRKDTATRCRPRPYRPTKAISWSAPAASIAKVPALSPLARYQASTERSIDWCLRHLKALQAARAKPDPSNPAT